MRKRTFKALRKKPVLALVVGAVVFSSAFGFAATLGVSGQTLGAGNAAVSSCAASVTTAYSVAYDSTIPGYKVSGVTVTGTLTSCSGKSMTVDLVNSANSSLVSMTHTITAAEATAGSVSLTPGSSVTAANVANVHAVISG
jgi:membrane-bound inhibitor of C-type lysozyme